MTTIYEGNVPKKCEASEKFDCKNMDKTLEELGVFYESKLPDRDLSSCICESCHFTYGLGRFNSDLPSAQKFELNESGNWVLVEEEIDKEKLEKMEQEVREGFFAKVKKVAKHLPFAETAVACYYCAVDSKTPIYVKASLIAALVYFINPWDLIPDVIPGAGYADDALLIFGVAKLFDEHLKKRHWTAAKHFWEDKQVSGCKCPFCASF